MRIEERGHDISHLKERLLYRRNGDWLQSLRLQQEGPVQRLLSIFERVHTSDIPTLISMTKSTNIDVWVVSHAILAEWYILQGQFTKGEELLVPLCAHHDPYPKIIGLQQRALLYHHLDQQSRLSATHRKLKKSLVNRSPTKYDASSPIVSGTPICSPKKKSHPPT